MNDYIDDDGNIGMTTDKDMADKHGLLFVDRQLLNEQLEKVGDTTENFWAYIRTLIEDEDGESDDEETLTVRPTVIGTQPENFGDALRITGYSEDEIIKIVKREMHRIYKGRCYGQSIHGGKPKRADE